MKRFLALLTAVILIAGVEPAARSQTPGGPAVRRVHPLIHLKRPAHRTARPGATMPPTFEGYTPSQIRRAYGVSGLPSGLNGAGQVIAIVDAFDDATAASDLQMFITSFGLPGMHGLSSGDPCTVASGPHPCFQKIYAQSQPPASGDPTGPDPTGFWALEISLDVQWAHAIAPGADVLLMEAFSNDDTYMLPAVEAAVSSGARVVSMSWGESEYPTELQFDSLFRHDGVAFVAASGDMGTGTQWPAVSPYVVGVGGTTLVADDLGNVVSETAWLYSGGGISQYEPMPEYQANRGDTFLMLSRLQNLLDNTGGMRASPDVAYVADPDTGVQIYDSSPVCDDTGCFTGWFWVGGTSVGTPQWSAILALGNQVRAAQGVGSLSTGETLRSPVYSLPRRVFRDVTSGTNGPCGITIVCTALRGYDLVTGLGSPLVDRLVYALTGGGGENF